MVERSLAKAEVAGSSPVSRSNRTEANRPLFCWITDSGARSPSANSPVDCLAGPGSAAAQAVSGVSEQRAEKRRAPFPAPTEQRPTGLFSVGLQIVGLEARRQTVRWTVWQGRVAHAVHSCERCERAAGGEAESPVSRSNRTEAERPLFCWITDSGARSPSANSPVDCLAGPGNAAAQAVSGVSEQRAEKRRAPFPAPTEQRPKGSFLLDYRMK